LSVLHLRVDCDRTDAVDHRPLIEKVASDDPSGFLRDNPEDAGVSDQP
jgi:hypothetical protein